MRDFNETCVKMLAINPRIHLIDSFNKNLILFFLTVKINKLQKYLQNNR